MSDQTEDERCREARQFERIDTAFKAGDLDALRAAVGDQGVIPNGAMPITIGPCLVYAIYHSPLAFIRTLLEIGADPNADDHDGFPPLIAALTKTRAHPGSPARPDVNEVIALLLSFGSDPNQRGINDYTPLHQAVAEQNLRAVELLLASGADPLLKTRIDECETALAMAERSGLIEIGAALRAGPKPRPG